MAMLSLTGVHGTSVSNAKAIIRQGFYASIGRRGKGVYFWSYLDAIDYAKDLGFCWCLDRYPKNDCAVLVCSFECDHELYIDFDSLEHVEGFRRVSKAFMDKFPVDSTKQNDFINKLYDYYIGKVESEKSISYVVCHAKVAPPKSANINVNVFGGASCYVVRHTAVITVKEVLAKGGKVLWTPA